jgi:aminoglycoside 2'-N-acetyltransferase I
MSRSFDGELLLRRVPTADLTPADVAAIRELMLVAFGADDDERFTDDDWQHAIGGLHFVLDLNGEVVTHASVVEREIHVDGHPCRTGYVEAVATAPDRQGGGFGTMVMADVTSYIRDWFELGALGTGRHRFYERLGGRPGPGRLQFGRPTALAGRPKMMVPSSCCPPPRRLRWT